jgi:predicted regulator of Ras-like GTPase activity (Roadblock/LC7/MglB family)
MPLEGSLKELSLANLIQLNCQEKNEVGIILSYLGKEGNIFCSGGNIVHANAGHLIGVEAVYELLRWKGGTFRVQNNVTPPERTIDRSWDSVLLEGMQRIDEGVLSQEEKLDKLVCDLSEMNNVSGAIIVAKDGTILAEAIEGNAEEEGAVAVFLGNAASQIGETLSLGRLDWGVANLGQSRILILERLDFFIGLLLAEKVSPAMMAARVIEALDALE